VRRDVEGGKTRLERKQERGYLGVLSAMETFCGV